MDKVKTRILSLLRFGLGTRLLLSLFGVLVIIIIFIGLDDIPGYTLAYLATAVIFLIMVRGWRSIKNYVILLLGSFCGVIFLSFLDVVVIAGLACWIWGPEVVGSTPLRVIDWIIGNIVLFGGVVGLAYGFIGVLVLGILRLVRPKKHDRATNQT